MLQIEQSNVNMIVRQLSIFIALDLSVAFRWLESLGTKLSFDETGRVCKVSLRNTPVSDAGPVYLRGLAFLRHEGLALAA